MRTGLTKQEKTTDIWFDEKDPLIHIRTHNTDLKNRLTAYAVAHPDQCRQIDADPDTGCMEFEIRKGAFLFPSDRPIQRRTEERRQQSGKETFRQLDTPYSKRCAIIFLKKFRIRCSICR